MKRLLQLSRNGRCALFIGFNALALPAAVGLGAIVADSVQSQNDEIADKTNMLARLDAILAREGEVRAASDRIKAQSTEGDFLKAPMRGLLQPNFRSASRPLRSTMASVSWPSKA